MKKQTIKQPKMTSSRIIKARPLEEIYEEKMAEGGRVDMKEPKIPSIDESLEKSKKLNEELEHSIEQTADKRKQMAEGGELTAEEAEQEAMHDQENDMEYSSIAEAIMARRKMAEGGRVDIEENAKEQPNAFYKQNKAILKENYDSDLEDVHQPLDSNEHADDIESDLHDMVSKIRTKIKHRV